MEGNQQSPAWSPRGPCVGPTLPCSRRVSALGELSSALSSLPRLALAGPWEQSPSKSPGSWRAPWGPPYLFKLLARERQSTARSRRCFMSAARRQCWPRPRSAGAGSAVALFLYQQVHPRPGVPAPVITPLSMSTRGFGSGNESLTTSQVRQSECAGVKFVFVGEGLAAAGQDGARGLARTGQGVVLAAFGGSKGPTAGAEWGLHPSASPLSTGNHTAQLSWWNPPQMLQGSVSPFLCPTAAPRDLPMDMGCPTP